MIEPSYFGLTNDRTWISVDEEYYKKLKPTHRMKCYTHPVKELTDEEIEEIYRNSQERVLGELMLDHMKFAKAILRKAQEK